MTAKKQVLLIDDDIDDQEIFNLALQQADQHAGCVFADDGKLALEKLEEDKTFIPDLIFIDMNMPRMNGKQCLTSIRKIERLKDVPVYMYSTAADPTVVEEHIALGAEDYIVKPSDINVLIHLLKGILKKHATVFMLALFCVFLQPQKGVAQTMTQPEDTLSQVKQLKQLSFEQLMNVVVTSPSRNPEKLSETASAIQVITSEDIQRSTATRLPEALRLATNMQVAQMGSHDWSLTSRGFNGLPVSNSSLANKLLVLIDGRSVYTPLFGGVFWDVQNVLLEDVQQIEVISGPGGALWGANAVNGIVNIVNKSAKETQGLYVTAAGGDFLQDKFAIRYGSQIDSTLFWKVYGQRFDFNNSYVDGKDAGDSWNMNQGGFRFDFLPASKHSLTLQGDFYEGTENDSAQLHVNGQNAMLRYAYHFTDSTSVNAQVYFDRTYRNIQVQHFRDQMQTFDIDLQHNFALGKQNMIIWGFGYRFANDSINSFQQDFKPYNKNLPLISGFIQDQLWLMKRKMSVSLGIKLIDNVYTGAEFHPAIKVAYTMMKNHTVWGAVSRGVRTPTRFDRDNMGAVLGSDGEMQSESVIAYEIGYKMAMNGSTSFAISTYFNDYSNLRSIDTNTTAPPIFYFANHLEAKAYGVEFSFNYIATSWWRLRGGYTWQDKVFTKSNPKTYPKTEYFEANDPQNSFLLQSMINIGKEFQFDQIIRYVDVLPSGITSKTPSYISADVQVSWTRKWLTVTVAGQNLLEEKHHEFGPREIPRSVYGKITARF